MALALIIIYCVCMLYLFAFSLGQLHLTILYNKRKDQHTPEPELPDPLPTVTIQLPVYNERFVVERLIDAVATIRYPRHLLEIQVLDDSTDETTDIIRKKVDHYQQKGHRILHITRDKRTGFKAGALSYGLEKTDSEFIAVFDADFLPPENFLQQTLGQFKDEQTGVVQTRWSHLNQDYSVLTRLQAFGLDGHFTVEQGGRTQAGSFINFNGTAGVWRKKCIQEAGGWSADTLTEDLDLSYRAQMKGWKIKYLETPGCPAELPVLMDNIKSQQYRWNKGAAETARKLLSSIMTSPMKPTNKLHAFFHLTNSMVFLFLLVASIVSVPILYLKEQIPEYNILFNIGSIFLIGFFSIAFFYWSVTKKFHQKPLGYFIRYFPLFLSVNMGLALHNGIAVLEGIVGIRTPFIRTPKFNIRTKADKLSGGTYLKKTLSTAGILEIILALYFTGGVLLGVYVGDFGLLVFHVMLAFGYSFVSYYSLKHRHYAFAKN